LFVNGARENGVITRDVALIIVPLCAIPKMIQQATACLLWQDRDSEFDLSLGIMH
jgi:hypothetical protein